MIKVNMTKTDLNDLIELLGQSIYFLQGQLKEGFDIKDGQRRLNKYAKLYKKLDEFRG